MENPPKNNQVHFWQKTIFAQFDNKELAGCLKKWTSSKNYNLVWGRTDTPDLVAIGHFAAIIDRNLVGEEIYLTYLSLIAEVNVSKTVLGEEIKDESICIIVDNSKILDFPNLDFIFQINLNNADAIEYIIKILEVSSQLLKTKYGV